MNAMDFDDLLVRAVNLLELFQEVRDRYAQRVPLRDGRRVPGHQPRPVPLAPAADLRAPQPGGRRRRRSVDLRLPRRRHPEHPATSRTTSPTRTSSSSSRTTARRRRSWPPPTRSIANNRGQMAKTLWTDLGEGDPIRVRELADEHAEARFVTAEIERLVDEGVSRGRDRGLLPDQRAVAGARGHARAGADRLPGDRRHEVLRARRDQGRVSLPDVPRQPAGRGRRSRGSPTRRGAGSGRRRCRACSATPTRWGSRSGTRPRSRASVPGLGTAARKALGRFMSTMERLRERVEGGAPVGDVLEEVLAETGYIEALEAERTIEAQGRIENLEELVRVAPRVRRDRRGGRLARRVPAADRAARRRGRPPATTRAS